eukprot:9080440-Pyramimonas_sp.AAC.1
MRSNFALVGSDARQAFIERSRSLFGADLKMAIEDLIEVTLTATRSQGFSGQGKWLDFHEIDEKFAGGIAQADAARRNARKMYDQDRECELWEVFDYTSNHNTAVMEQESRKRRAQQELQARPKAKAKAKPKAKARAENGGEGAAETSGEGASGAGAAEAPPEDNTKALTPSQTKTLEK